MELLILILPFALPWQCRKMYSVKYSFHKYWRLYHPSKPIIFWRGRLIYAIWEQIFKYFDGLVTRNSFLFYFSEEILWFWLKELKILNKVVSFLLLSFRSLFIRCISIKVFFHNFSNYNISFVRGKLERLTTSKCILWHSISLSFCSYIIIYDSL